jgi:hypothetical protein
MIQISFEENVSADFKPSAVLIKNLAAKSACEVVFERKLQLVSVAMKTIGIVLALAPLEFPAHHDVGHGVEDNVAQSVLPHLEGVRQLAVRIVDILA